MAQKPPTIDRFRIMCEAEAAEMGPIIAQLSRMGLTNVHFELITDVVRFGKNGPRPEISSQELLTAWIKDHPTFKALDAVKHFAEHGRSNTAVYPALAVLCEKGVLKKNAPGNYSRTDVKAIEAGEHTKVPAKKKQRAVTEHRKTFAKRGEDVILAYAKRNHRRFNVGKLVEIFTKEGRARNSVYASVNALLEQKQAKRVGASGSGEYVLTNKASKANPTAAHKANGSTAPVVETPVEVSAHG